jgi:replicative DNA helicase
MIDRPLPADINAERATLGACLLDRDAILDVAPLLQPEDFYLQKHGWIYAAMLACYHQRIPPDISTVADDLRRHERLDLVGGITYLAELSAEVPTAVHATYYAHIVERTATLRRLIEAGGHVTTLGYDERESLDITLDKAEQMIFAVTQRQRGNDFVALEVAANEFFEAMMRDDTGILSTGLFDLDRRLNGGLHPANLVLLAARPGVGKSGLALSIAHHIAVERGGSVGFVSLEMSRNELLQRLVAMDIGHDLRMIRDSIRAGDAAVLDSIGRMANARIYLDATPGLSLMDVRSKARRLHLHTPLDLLVVDYLQLLISGEKTANRVDEVSRISQGLKALARELNCPVLALSQLSRAVEQRTNHVPVLSDLRDSGQLEADADVVLFLHREEVYDKQSEKKGLANIYIAKNRQGPLGEVQVRFDAPTTRFQNLQRGREVEGY